MNESVLVLENEDMRLRAKKIARSLGAKLLHDSGGRVLVFRNEEDAEKVAKNLETGAAPVRPEKITKDMRKGLSIQDDLFASAVKMRASKAYREMKAAQTPGESPEEKLLVTGSCIAED